MACDYSQNGDRSQPVDVRAVGKFVGQSLISLHVLVYLLAVRFKVNTAVQQGVDRGQSRTRSEQSRTY